MKAPAQTPKKRSWLRFSLRSFLIALTAICVLGGWKLERVRRQREAVKWVRNQDGVVLYDYGSFAVQTNPKGPYDFSEPNGATQWFCNYVGEDFVFDVRMIWLYDKKPFDISPIMPLTAVESLDLNATPVVDLSPLSKLTALQNLILDFTPVVDLSPLSNLSELKTLDLRGCPVTDISPLANLIHLRHLELRGTRVTDLSPIADLPNVSVTVSEGTYVIPNALKGRVHIVD
jgi:hypothetical protein